MNCLVVGANGGLAVETIKCLIEEGVQNITMACRTKEKADGAKKNILDSLDVKKNVNISTAGGFDMLSPDMIKEAVDNLKPTTPFDVVFLAAGGLVVGNKFESVSWKGKQIEKSLFQNTIGSHLTFINLKKNNLLADQARIVIAGGEGARGLPGNIDKPSFGTVENLKSYVYCNSIESSKYNMFNALGASKFFGALWSQKIATFEQGKMSIVWFSPGFTYGTSGLKNVSPVKRWIFENIMFKIFAFIGKAQSPKAGGRKNADCLLGRVGNNGDLIGSPEGKGIGPLVDQKPMNVDFTNTKLIEEFFRILEDSFGKYPN